MGILEQFFISKIFEIYSRGRKIKNYLAADIIVAFFAFLINSLTSLTP